MRQHRVLRLDQPAIVPAVGDLENEPVATGGLETEVLIAFAGKYGPRSRHAKGTPRDVDRLVDRETRCPEEQIVHHVDYRRLRRVSPICRTLYWLQSARSRTIAETARQYSRAHWHRL